jgi:hypothetical protein
MKQAAPEKLVVDSVFASSTPTVAGPNAKIKPILNPIKPSSDDEANAIRRIS